MNDSELLVHVNNELQHCAGGNENDFLDANRKEALAAYLGQPNGKEVEGRSTVTSTDVADAIEWIMPLVMEQLTSGIPVQFDALYEEDIVDAEMQSQFCFDVMMRKNPGFMICHDAVKDALMQKTGFTETKYVRDEKIRYKRYTGVDATQLEVILEPDEAEIAQLSERETPAGTVFDIKVKLTSVKEKINVCAFPPEEFRINRQHNTHRIQDSKFSARVELVTASDLIESGIPKEVVDDIPSGIGDDHDRDYRFYYQQETVYPQRDLSLDPSMRIIEVADCYMWLDIDDDGIAEYVRVKVANPSNPSHVLEVEELEGEEDNPYVGWSAILMSHKFFGLSIYDRLKEIQEQKTMLTRNWFDNLYLHNNQRLAVLEGVVNLDDLLISRPGGIIRQKAMGAVEPIPVQPVGVDAKNMIDYLDQVRASRVGVNPEGPLQIQDLGDRVGSQGVANLLAAREAVVDLIVRVVTETGMKEQFYKIQTQAAKHMGVVQNMNFRNNWVKFRPTDWTQRTQATCLVGTGSGGTAVDREAIMAVVQAHTDIKRNEPDQVLFGEEERFRAWERFCRLSGMPLATKYFVDPASPKGQQAMQQRGQAQQQEKQKSEQMDASMMKLQADVAQAEVGKAQANMTNVQLQAQIDNLKVQLDEAKAAIDAAQKHDQLQFQYDEMNTNASLKMTELEVKGKLEASKIQAANKKEAENASGPSNKGNSAGQSS